jgi:hypothetical protein
LSAAGRTSPVPAAPGKAVRYWLWRPPGALFYVAVVLAAVMGLWVSSIQSVVGSWGFQAIWIALAGVWFIRVLGAAVVQRLRFGVVEWIRWLAVPAILGVVVAITQASAPFDVRLSLSRAGMDEAAAEVMAGGTTDRQWIGLWPVQDVERIPGGMRFIVMGGGFIDRWGFAYSQTGDRPAIMDGEDRYERLDGDWWLWIDGF